MRDDEILFAKLYEDVKIPTKDVENGGYDIYAHFEGPSMTIAPHETKLIPTGLLSAFSNRYVFILKERGSTGAKGIGQRSGVIDSGFRGEWHIAVTNHNDKPLVITKEEKEGGTFSSAYLVHPYAKAICQGILVPVPSVTVREVSPDEIMAVKSTRGTGKLGSSGK